MWMSSWALIMIVQPTSRLKHPISKSHQKNSKHTKNRCLRKLPPKSLLARNQTPLTTMMPRPILSNKQIENSQLDNGYDIHKNVLSDDTTSQESNTSEEPEIENLHHHDTQHIHRPPQHNEKVSLSALSSSVSQYFQTMSHINSTYLTKNHSPRTFPIKP